MESITTPRGTTNRDLATIETGIIDAHLIAIEHQLGELAGILDRVRDAARRLHRLDQAEIGLLEAQMRAMRAHPSSQAVTDERLHELCVEYLQGGE